MPAPNDMVPILDLFPSLNTLLLVIVLVWQSRIWIYLQRICLLLETNQRLLGILHSACPIVHASVHDSTAFAEGTGRRPSLPS